jgi:hypothetical protein
LPEVLPRRVFKKIVKMIGAEDARPVQKGLQDAAALQPEDESRYMGILLPNLALVLLEPLICGAKNRQVDIYEHLFIGRHRHGGVSGCQHQRFDQGCRFRRDSGMSKGATGPFCASSFVVLAAHVINGVVKPQGDLDRGGVQGQMLGSFECCKAFREVMQRVVLPVRLVVRSNERIED